MGSPVLTSPLKESLFGFGTFFAIIVLSFVFLERTKGLSNTDHVFLQNMWLLPPLACLCFHSLRARPSSAFSASRCRPCGLAAASWLLRPGGRFCTKSHVRRTAERRPAISRGLEEDDRFPTHYSADDRSWQHCNSDGAVRQSACY